MNLQQVGVGAVVVGIVLLVLSFSWQVIVPDEAVWSKEQAIQFQENSAQLHADSFNTDLPPEKLAASQASFDASKKQLDRARTIKATTPFYIRVTGISVCILGAVILVAFRDSE